MVHGNAKEIAAADDEPGRGVNVVVVVVGAVDDLGGRCPAHNSCEWDCLILKQRFGSDWTALTDANKTTLYQVKGLIVRVSRAAVALAASKLCQTVIQETDPARSSEETQPFSCHAS